MALIDLLDGVDVQQRGEEMYALATTLYPICRSITGNGVRQTLQLLQAHVPLTVHEVASGTPVFDWVVPREWNIRDAYVIAPNGEKILDFQQCNLHVLNYSMPFHGTVSLQELQSHLFTLPDHPEWIPYRTSYYNDNWGFCLSHRQCEALEDGAYEVVIDTTLEDGALTYGELCIPGKTDQEILLSCHVCHPSLCNDNLSGNTLCVQLAQILANVETQYSYRFLFIPGTIGSITWLSLNEAVTPRIAHGLVVTCVGDSGGFTYKRSRRGTAEIDQVVEHCLAYSEAEHRVIDFYPYGYDERQYCSPGFNLAVGSLTRSSHGQFPEYHTSADNLTLVSAENLASSLHMYLTVLDTLENNHVFVNQNPKCEPQLGKRGLYGGIGAAAHRPVNEMALLWVLNQADGTQSLLEIAERAHMPFGDVKNAAAALLDCGLLAPQ